MPRSATRNEHHACSLNYTCKFISATATDTKPKWTWHEACILQLTYHATLAEISYFTHKRSNVQTQTKMKRNIKRNKTVTFRIR